MIITAPATLKNNLKIDDEVAAAYNPIKLNILSCKVTNFYLITLRSQNQS